MAGSSEASERANSSGSPEEGNGATMTVDTLFELLSNSRRRAVVGLLLDRERPIPVSTLAERLAEREGGSDITGRFEDDAAAICVALFHVHLPKLADSGVVEYDHERALVVPTDRLERLAPYVSPPNESTPRST